MDISVGQICARACLTRPTFYNHYSTKQALVAEVIDDALEEFASHVERAKIENTQGLLRAYLDYWATHGELLGLISKNGLLPMVGDRFRPYLERIYADAPFTDKSLSTEELAFHNAFLSAGMAGLLGHWTQGGRSVGADTVTEFMENMLSNMQAGMEDKLS